MPVISFVSSKGGAGKTTAAVILATVLADAIEEAGAGSVALLDADPNQPIVRWAASAELPQKLTVLGSITEDNILETIEYEARSRKFVIVDTEGSANLALNYAMSQSHLVVIPVQASHLDADEAARTIKLIERLRRTTLRRDRLRRCLAAGECGDRDGDRKGDPPSVPGGADSGASHQACRAGGFQGYLLVRPHPLYSHRPASQDPRKGAGQCRRVRRGSRGAHQGAAAA